MWKSDLERLGRNQLLDRITEAEAILEEIFSNLETEIKTGSPNYTLIRDYLLKIGCADQPIIIEDNITG